MFLLLLAICIATIIALSNFIWNIEITGTNKINKDEIMQILEETNFKVGTLKSKADTKEAINKIRLERDDVAWVGIDIKGTNAVVEIVEADEKPEIINEEEYCNLVASRDGIISKVNAANGTPLVKEGDVVKKGDILVAGWLEGKYTGTRYVHATGSVEARVWYSQKEKVPLKQIEKEYPELITKDSPTQKVGSSIKKGFAKVTHEVPLQSLQDVFTFEEVEEFDERMQKAAIEYGRPLDYVVETKIDGLSAA